MPTKLKKDSIILSAILLSEGENKNFTDIELSGKLGVKRDELLSYLKENKIDELRGSKKNEIICDCGSQVDIFEGMKTAYCKKCGKEFTQIPFWNFGLNSEKVIEFLKERVTTLLKGSKILSYDGNKLILQYKNLRFSMIIDVERTGLDELYKLMGWSKDSNPDFNIVVGIYPTFTLSSQHSKGMVGMLTMEKLFDRKLFEDELKVIEIDILERRKELGLKWSYKEGKDWVEIEKFWEDILKNAETYSIQSGTESSKVQGEKFQEYIVDLLRITIFDAKHLGGKNLPDGAIFVRATQHKRQGELIPLEIKSDKTGFVHLQEHEGQIRKYLDAFKNGYVTERYDVSRVMIFGHDFDIDNSKDSEIIEKLENDFGVKIILFPLKSLVRLVNLFFKYKITDIDNDRIFDFLKSGYVEEKDVESLMNKLKSDTDSKNKDMFEKVERIVKSHGY